MPRSCSSSQEVHRGRSLVNLAHLVVPPRVVQHTLGDRGLAGIDMCAQIPMLRTVGKVGRHGGSPFWCR